MKLFKRKKDKKSLPASKDKSFDELSQMVDKKEREKSTDVDHAPRKEQVKKPEELDVGTEQRSVRKKKEKDKKKEDKSAKGGSASGGKDHGQAYKNLIRPVITEKASFLGMYNQYVFEIAPRANKIEIKKAIEKLYGVKPVKINIINMRGKNVRYGRQMGKLKNWKKAIITLKSGDKIDVYEGV